jgi:hypothetical protein
MHRHLITPRATGLAFVALAVSALPADASDRREPPTEFEFATIIVERNATDGDTEIVITAKPGDEGLRFFTIHTPGGRSVGQVFSLDRTIMGLREFVFESPEPPGEAILAAYPEGTYTFVGRSTTGERFRSEARLSHQLPASTVILFPLEDSEVGTDSLTIQWSAVPGIREFILEFENESVEPQQVLRLNVPADQTSFEVPAAMLVPGADYQVGVASVAQNGNVVFVETTFSTAEN